MLCSQIILNGHLFKYDLFSSSNSLSYWSITSQICFLNFHASSSFSTLSSPPIDYPELLQFVRQFVEHQNLQSSGERSNSILHSPIVSQKCCRFTHCPVPRRHIKTLYFARVPWLSVAVRWNSHRLFGLG